MGAFVLFDAVPLLFCRFLPCRSILKWDLEEGVKTLFAWKNEPSLMALFHKHKKRRSDNEAPLHFRVEARKVLSRVYHVDRNEG
jgi:hypothetical protein